jgi:multiple sugar transport system substrate-binding protein
MLALGFFVLGENIQSTEAFAGKRFEGVTVTLGVFAGGVEGSHSGPYFHFRNQWEKETGAKLNIIQVPFEQLLTKFKTDILTGAGVFDVYHTMQHVYGDLISGNYIIPIDKFLDDPDMPQWDPADMNPAVRQNVYMWGGKQYGANADSDAWVVYGRKDILTNPEYRSRFKSKYGYDLPLIPRTTEEFLDVSEFFNGWDWDGDGEIEYGNVLPLKVGGWGLLWFEAWAAAYGVVPGPVVDAYHNTFYFNPETMEPIINSPGHVRALEDYIRLSKFANSASISWGIGEAWDDFLKGNAVLTFSPGDIGTLAQDPDRSAIREKLVCGPMPGVMQLYDREYQKWVKLDKPNMVGNIVGSHWHPVISRLSKYPEAAYHLIAWMANRERRFQIVTWGWSGVDPGAIYDFPPEVSNGKGTGSIEAWLAQGFDKDDLITYLSAYWQNYYEMDTYMDFLRLPGTDEMRSIFDIEVAKALMGEVTPQKALDNAATEWKRVINTYGLEVEKLLYQQSVNYGGSPPKYSE